MANMNDVAKHAGVSKSTVSKVINGYDNLSEATIKRVNTAIKELEYVPNFSASSLSKKNTKKIGVLLKVNDDEQVIDEIYMRYLLGVDTACNQYEIENSIIFSKSISDKTCDQLIAYLYSKSITSLVIIGISKDDHVLQALVDREVFPTVVAEARITNTRTSSVGIDNCGAEYNIAKQAVEEHTPETILYIEGKSNGYISEYRKNGIEKLCAELNLDIDYYKGSFSEKKVFSKILNMKEHYDLIICASDLMAIGAKRALQAKGEYSDLIGFDGINLLSYVASDIPTVKQDFYQIAYSCVEEALRLQAGEKSQILELKYEITCIK